MIIFFAPGTSESRIEELQDYLKENGLESTWVPGTGYCLVPRLSDPLLLEKFDFIIRTQHINTAYQLASREFKAETAFEVNGISISSTQAIFIAGPCSIESERQIFDTAAFLQKNGIRFMRGGAYKPRTSPYSFRGLGKPGLQMMSEAARKHGLAMVTELMDLSLLDEVMEYADIIQIGSRNMDNFYLLSELGKIKKPVMLKRGMQSKVNEWLLAADYILTGGNDQVILCERGIRSFDPLSRNVMDVAAIPLVQSLSHLPVIADPSHGTGNSQLVGALAKASMVAGANGLMVEIHPDPSSARSDAHQAMSFENFEIMMKELRALSLFCKPFDVPAARS